MHRIIVRACRERTDHIDYLKKHIPEAEWCFDEKRDAMDTYLRSMVMAGIDPVIHMEEDVILCRDFRNRIESEISKRPNEVIQFFSMRNADLTIGSRYDAGSKFMMNQCFYLPAGYSKLVLDYKNKWSRILEHPTGTDIMFADMLKERKESYWIVVPNLVDHRVCKSLIDKRRSSKRTSKSFNHAEAL